MKVFVITNNYGANAGAPTGLYFISDSAVTNTGKPFYLPDEKGEVKVSLSIAVKFSRLGKSVASKFAPRYYAESAPALHFYLPDYEKVLKSEGLPADPSRNYDKCLTVGGFTTKEELKIVELYRNGEKVSDFSFEALEKPVDEMIEAVSRMNTLKMGDLLLPGLSEGTVLKVGDILEVRKDGKEAFKVRIK